MAFIPDKLHFIMGLRPTGDIGPFTFYTKVNNTIVFFPRAPPKCPPTEPQIYRRRQITEAAAAWQLLPDPARANWELATKRLSLRITGYNLWCWYYITGDSSIIATIARQSRLPLLPSYL